MQVLESYQCEAQKCGQTDSFQLYIVDAWEWHHYKIGITVEPHMHMVTIHVCSIMVLLGFAAG